MKSIILFFTLITTIQLSFSQDTETTTYYLIRHAEKDRSNPSEKNPHLDADGLKRAENWNTILSDITIDAVYSSDYHRTKETAQPTATRNKVDITLYNPSTINVPEFAKNTKGKTVLVVGHSNTIPAFVNGLIGSKKYADIDDAVSGHLYIVTIIGDKIHDQLLIIN
uniref:SixA phosphatase family protein n=1 Tax=Gelidibacter sp. TaxID=2018083 RepID=UPI00404A3CF8